MSDKLLSRRDFLKAVTIGIGAGVFIGNKIGSTIVDNLDPLPKNEPVTEKIELLPEQQKMVDEIAGFRKSLGLEGASDYMTTRLLGKNEWKEQPPSFENSLPEKNVSYGQYTKDALLAVFGTNSTRLVRGCEYDSETPGLMAFNTQNRFCVLPDGVHDFPIDKEYINFILHEAIGHGSDPFYEWANYPKDVFLKVEHGKWKALTQMFNLPGEMLNNPGDMMYPMLKKQVGRTVGETFIANGNLEKVLDGEGRNLIEQKITSLSESKGVSVKDLKFNKAVCMELSSMIIPSILNGTISIKGDLKNTYSYFLENFVAIEIYAEMVRYSISQPEKMNDTVIQGVTEMVSAINGVPVDLKEIMRKIEHPSQQVILRNTAEIEAMTNIQNTPNELTPISNITNPIPPEVYGTPPIPSEDNSTNGPVLSNQEIKTIAEQESKVDLEESDFDNFVNHGYIPNTLRFSPSQGPAIIKFANLYKDFNDRWPGVIYIDISNDDSFDPNMHLWEMENLEYAIDLSFIRAFLQNTEVSEQVISDIENKTKIIESLYSAPLFNQ